MQKMTLANNKNLDVYRTIPMNKDLAKSAKTLDTINKGDGADEIVYKQGQDVYMAVGRGDLRGVKAGDKVTVDGAEREVLYVSNKSNTKAEMGVKGALMAVVPGALIGACAAGIAAVTVGGAAAIAAGAIGGLLLGSLGVLAQAMHGFKGAPNSAWLKK